MRSILRLCPTFCTALPVQRYGICIGAVCAAVGIAFAIVSLLPSATAFLSTMARPLSVMAGSLGLTLLATSALVPAGWTFRKLSQLRAHRFAPRFRVKMLAALVAVAAAPSLLAGALVALAPGDVPILPALFYPALATSTTIWCLFFLPASILVAIVVSFAWTLLRLANPGLVDAIDDAAPSVGTIVLIAAWTAFGVWYLRAPRIGPFRSRALIRLLRIDAADARLPEFLSATTAIHTYLWRRLQPYASSSWPHVVARGALGGLLLAVIYAAVHDAWTLSMLYATSTIAAALVVLTAGRRAARDARRLWLKAAMSRAELFASVEAGLLRFCAIWTLMVAIAITVAGAVHDRALAPLASLGAALASTAMLGGYLGLAMPRLVGSFNVALVAAYAVSIVCATFLVGRGAAAAFWTLIGAQAAAALLCRALARRRWAEIDWLETKPSLDPTERLLRLMQSS